MTGEKSSTVCWFNEIFMFVGSQFTHLTPYKEHTYDESRGGVYSLRYSEGSRWIATGYHDGSIEVRVHCDMSHSVGKNHNVINIMQGWHIC